MPPNAAMGKANSIDDVLERMDDIERLLPSEDGVAVFNRMYRQVTRLIDQAVDQNLFEAGDFLARLDVHFANMFFDAYTADANGEKVPRAWAPLFEHRFRPNTHPIQFALAGMNAHISHDLPHAVVSACKEAALTPDDDTPHHHDFTATNNVLEDASDEIKSWFHTGLVAKLDDAGGRVDDALSMYGIALARSGSWLVGQTLWGLDDNPMMLSMFTKGHRRAVEMTSRGILI